MKKTLGIAVAVVALLCTPALAQFAASSTNVVDFNPIANQLTEALVNVALGLGMILASWLAYEIKKKWNIDVTTQVSNLEANYRDTLHSAVDTWTNSALAKFGPNLKIDVGSPAAAYIINGVQKSAADAVANLKPTEEWILAKAAGTLGISAPLAAAPQ